MPYEIKLPDRVGGYARGDVAAGEMMQMIVTEFTSSSDGELFVSRLEGLPNRLLSLLPGEVDASTINHLIAIIRRDGTAALYVNECSLLGEMRLGRRIEQGETIFENYIIDIASVAFKPAEFPPDAGIVCVISSGWRKGLLFDLRPLHPPYAPRTFDIPSKLGACMSHMIHHDLFSLTVEDWRFMFDERWFPFATLDRPVRRSLIGRAQRRSDLNCMLPQILASVRKMLPHLRARWAESAILKPHLSLLLHALDRFEEEDYVSCTAILYPRTEGVLRSVHEALAASRKPTAKVLSGIATEGKRHELHEFSWMVPEQFEAYLRNVYFANFEPGQQARFSRHSVSHGVATAEEFDAKSACISILALDQIFYLLPSPSAQLELP